MFALSYALFLLFLQRGLQIYEPILQLVFKLCVSKYPIFDLPNLK